MGDQFIVSACKGPYHFTANFKHIEEASFTIKFDLTFKNKDYRYIVASTNEERFSETDLLYIKKIVKEIDENLKMVDKDFSTIVRSISEYITDDRGNVPWTHCCWDTSASYDGAYLFFSEIPQHLSQYASSIEMKLKDNLKNMHFSCHDSSVAKKARVLGISELHTKKSKREGTSSFSKLFERFNTALLRANEVASLISAKKTQDEGYSRSRDEGYSRSRDEGYSMSRDEGYSRSRGEGYSRSRGVKRKR